MNCKKSFRSPRATALNDPYTRLNATIAPTEKKNRTYVTNVTKHTCHRTNTMLN